MDGLGLVRDALKGEMATVVTGKPVQNVDPLPSRFPPLQSTMTLAQTQTVSFWNQPFFLQPVPKLYVFTNENIAGGSGLALGAVYGVSYAYYQYSIAQEEAAAQKKKEAVTAKRRAAATNVVEEPETIETVSEQEPVTVASPSMTKQEEMALEKARAAVERAKRFDMAARMAERNKYLEEVDLEPSHLDIDVEEETVPKKRWWTFWRWRT